VAEGDTARTQATIREERERFKKRWGDDPWSRENREALKAQLKEKREDVQVQADLQNV
jgi:hypothetical protein